MGRIFCILGKSASGKDAIYRRLKELVPGLGSYVMYTTRPIRAGETDGVSYHFTDEAALDRFRAEGRLIESRTYNTIYGPWTYATVDDGQIDLGARDYIMSGTLVSFKYLRDYYGSDAVIPVYIEVDDGERLIRAVRREMQEAVPKYTEVCRRFIADSEDFSEDNIRAAGIDRRYKNDDLERCAGEIISTLRM